MTKQQSRTLFRLLIIMEAAVGLWLASAVAARAGTVETVRSALCDVRYSGEVETGDSEKLVAALQAVDLKMLPAGRLRNEYELSNDIAVPWLCLNSPGGSFGEAVAFIRATLLQVNFAAVVGPKAECYSACALMFLGGHIHEGDGYFELYRRLSMDAQLGFHAPYLGPVAPVMNDKVIGASYRAGVLAVADLLSLNEGFFPRGLLAEFLRVGPDDFYRIDRIGQLAAWQINLLGYRRPVSFTEDQFETVCHNERTKANRYFTKADIAFSEEVARTAAQSVRKRITPGETFARWHEEAIEGVAECTVLARLHGGRLFLSADAARATMADRADQSFISNSVAQQLSKVDPDSYTPAFFLFPQHTPISSLEPAGVGEQAPPERPAAARPEAGEGLAAEDSLWDHNGSTARLRLLPESAVMDYETPREGMRKAGAKPGDNLFTVARSGARLSGSSRIFSRRCGNQEFPVEGTLSADRRTIRLKGRAPSLGPDCEIKGWIDQDLIFSYLPPAQ
jgi:hypothetical protein